MRFRLPRGEHVAPLLVLLALAAAPVPAFAQFPMLFYDFENNALRTTYDGSAELWINPGASDLLRHGNTTTITGVPGAGSFTPGTAASGTDWQNVAADPGIAATDYYEFSFSTSGLRGISLFWAVNASADGPGLHGLLYSTDGVNFTAAGPAQPTANAADWKNGFGFYDLTGVSALDDQPLVTLRIYACKGANGAFANTGTYAIDQLQVDVLETKPNAGVKTLIDETAFFTSYTSGQTGAFFSRSSFVARGPNTTVRLASTVSVDIDFAVRDGATMEFGAPEGPVFAVRGLGTASFTLDAASTVRLNAPAGIAISSSLGNIRTLNRFLSPAATYVYVRNAAGAQSTGAALPTSLTGRVVVALGPAATDPLTLSNAATTFGEVRLESGGMDFGTSASVATALVRAGGTVAAAHPPTYLAGSTLRYETAAAIGNEWLGGTSGPGVPRHVAVGPVAVDFNPAWSATPHGALGNLAIAPGGSLVLGTAAPFTLAVGGDVALDGSLVANGRPLRVNGTADQLLTGPGGGVVLDRLEVAKPSGDLRLATPLRIDGNLDLAGVIDPGTHGLTFGPAMTLAWTSGAVRGGLTRELPAGAGTYVYPLGDAAASAAVTATVDVTTPGALRWTTTAGDHPDVAASRIDPARSVNRWWTATTVAPLVLAPGAMGLSFGAGDLDAGADPLHFSVHQRDGSWVPIPATARTASTIGWNQAGPLAGDFAVGEAPWTITATAGPHGTIAPAGAVAVADGSTPVFTMTPDTNYVVADVLVDGVSVGPQTSYAFPAVGIDHTIEATFVGIPRLTWASTGSTDWAVAANWFDEVTAAPALAVPGSGDLVLVDGSRGATVDPVVGSGAQACKRLTIGNGFTVTLSGATASLVVGDGAPGTTDLHVLDGGTLRNQSTAPAGTPLALASSSLDRFRVEDGGFYLHDTPRSFATPFPAGACEFLPASTVEFGPAIGNAVTLSGRTYGNLRLSATAPKAYTGTVGGANGLSILGELRLTSSFVSLTATLTSSATCTLNHLRIDGGTLSFATSTMPLRLTGNIVNTGTLTTSATQPVTFDGASEVSSGGPVTWNDGFVLLPGRTLGLACVFDWPASRAGDVRGALVLRGGGGLGRNPKYAAGSSLEYASPSGFVVNNEWAAGGPGTDGVPRHVIVSAGPVFMPAAERTLDGSLDLNGSLFGISPPGGDLHVTGDWRQDGGVFSSSGSAVILDGAADAVVSSAAGVDIPQLVVDKGAHQVTLDAAPATELRVSGELSLVSGRIATGSNLVVVQPGGIVSRVAGHVDGTLRRTPGAGTGALAFDVGSGTTYAPVGLAFTNADGAGTITVHSVTGDHPDVAASGIDATRSLDRTWTVAAAGAAFDSCDATFGFAAADVDSGADPLAFVARKYDGGTWTRPAAIAGPSSIQVNGLTSFSEFAFGEPVQHTITASAGPGGAIAPAGPVPVADGADQEFLVTADPGFMVADVLVDGGSVGAVSGWTFPAVTTDHTIAASFGEIVTPNKIVAVAPGTCLSTVNACVVVPVTIARTEATGIRAFSVDISLSPELELCAAPAASILEGPYLAGAGTTLLQVIDHGDGAYTVDGTILGQPCGATDAAGTLFTVAVKQAAGGPEGNGTLTVGGTRLRDCVNAPLVVSAGPVATIPIDTTAPDAIAGLVAQQVKSGNDADGTTRIQVTWPAPEAGSTVEVWRAGFGNHPEYDNPPTPGAEPAVPAYPPGPPWTLTGLTVPGASDEVAARDFWYYVAFVKDACGNVSAASNRTDGTLNYHLGDVTDGVNPGSGDNVVSTVDVSLLGAYYGSSGPAVAPVAYLDVGPTTDTSVDGRPTPDDLLDFEDLILFAINYLTVSAPGPVGGEGGGAIASGPDRLTVSSEGAPGIGGTITAHLALSGSGRVQGLSARLSWDPRVVAPEAPVAGALLEGAGGIVLSPAAGTVDAVLLGVRPVGLAGEGDVATIRFRVVGPGDPGIALAAAVARDAHNRPVDLGQVVGVPAGPPGATRLLPASPNPSAGGTRLGFSLARAGRVELSIYAVDGRRVRTLVAEDREAGLHEVTWDGTGGDGRRVAAGVYFVALSTPEGRFRQSIVRAR